MDIDDWITEETMFKYTDTDYRLHGENQIIIISHYLLKVVGGCQCLHTFTSLCHLLN